MKKLIALFLVAIQLHATECAVTYAFSGGRFGDNLLSYLHAKWLSHKFEIPLLYKPFCYSSDLVLHDREILYNPNITWSNQITLGARCKRPFLIGNYLFTCPYFPEVDWEYTIDNFFKIEVDWKDKTFRKTVNELIAPNRPCLLTIPTKEAISIAVHIRDGGSHDDYELRFKHPLKVPPLSFYADCLKKILNLMQDRQIYCFFFTDSLNPEDLVANLQKLLPENAPIIFDYRKEGNHDDKNVLEDFFSLFNFDILIRPASNFSIIPSLIHDYALVFYPTKCIRGDGIGIITETIMDKNDELFECCMKKGIYE